MVQTAHDLGCIGLHLAGMRLDTVGFVGPGRGLRECARRELWAQRGARDQGDEQAQRGDDCDDRLPPSSLKSALKAHSGRTVQEETWAVAHRQL